MDDDKLIDLETRIAHQERQIEELGDILTDQQQQIDRLSALCRSLTDRVRSLGEGGGADTGTPDDERPPHY